jgi:hypothetical protein
MIEEAERVSRDEAAKRGLGDLLQGASRHPIAVETNDGEIVMVSRDLVDQVLEALEVRDDLYDMIQAVARMVTDDGDHVTLSDFIAELGLTEDEITTAEHTLRSTKRRPGAWSRCPTAKCATTSKTYSPRSAAWIA